MFDLTWEPFSPKIRKSDDHKFCLYYSAFIILLTVTRSPTALAEIHPPWHTNQPKKALSCVSFLTFWPTFIYKNNFTFGPMNSPRFTQHCLFLWKVRWLLSCNMCLQDKDLILVPDTEQHFCLSLREIIKTQHLARLQHSILVTPIIVKFHISHIILWVLFLVQPFCCLWYPC